jgi:hypothetical protein
LRFAGYANCLLALRFDSGGITRALDQNNRAHLRRDRTSLRNSRRSLCFCDLFIGVGVSSPGNYPLVFVKRPDPKPVSGVALNVHQRAIAGVANSNRPNFANLFKVQ